MVDGCRLSVVGCRLSVFFKQNMKDNKKEYTDLEVWQECRKLTNHVYEVSRNFPKEELYGLTNQIRRSAVSIPSNIAEGCGRSTSKDTLHFLHIARGSLYEVETQIFIALDQNYITKEIFESLFETVQRCKRILNGFINYYRKLND
jgi:four helix bundle protein